MLRLSTLLVLAGLVAGAGAADAQSLRRESEGIRYRPEPVIGGMSAEDWVSWQYDEETHEWNKGVSIKRCRHGSILGQWLELKGIVLRTAVVNSDTLGVLEVYNRDPFADFESTYQALVINADGVRDSILDYIAALDTAMAEDYTPGYAEFAMPIYSADFMTKGKDSAHYDNLIRAAEKMKYEEFAPVFGLYIFPVKIEGVKSIRFMLGAPTPDRYRYGRFLFSGTCFDNGYYEMTVDKFTAFIKALR